MSSKDPKYIQNDTIWTQNRPKYAQIIESLKKLKRVSMSSNLNKNFTCDTYTV